MKLSTHHLDPPQLTKARESKNLPYSEVRAREFLYENEVRSMIRAAKKNQRHGLRNELLILMAYNHGLRIAELVGLRWHQIDFEGAVVLVRRLKGSKDSAQPIGGKELRRLRQLRRLHPDAAFVFLSQQKAPLSADGARKVIRQAGEDAAIGFPVHPHMLRHACGYRLANQGHDTRAIQDFLGHVNIHHTVRYTQLSAKRFENFVLD